MLHTAGGDVLEKAPVLYQEMGGVRQAVSGRFVLEGKNQVGFQVGAYDPSRPLVIDPVLSYSTFFGGNFNFGYGIAVDASGDAYFTGYTESSDIPTTPDAYEELPTVPGANHGAFSGPGLYGGSADAFVAELNSSGMALVYSTYLGGGFNTRTFGNAIAVDASGNAYVTGWTNSGESHGGADDAFPTTSNAYLSTLQSLNGNAFVTELNSSGSALRLLHLPRRQRRRRHGLRHRRLHRFRREYLRVRHGNSRLRLPYYPKGLSVYARRHLRGEAAN